MTPLIIEKLLQRKAQTDISSPLHSINRPFSRQRDIDKYSFFQKTKFIINFVTSVIVKMQSFDEIAQKLAKIARKCMCLAF